METGINVRVSTEEQAQEGFSVRAQEQKLKDYARIKDWSIYKIYMDEGISGKNLVDRPAVQEMIEDIESGAVKNVLVFKIDRLTRSTADLIYLTELFNENDCAFNSLTESIDTQTASGRMFLKIIGIFAEFERENIIERIKVGIERKVNEGYAIGGITSYGYDRPKNQKIQTINEQESKIVQEIFDMFVNQGVSINDIARRLNVRKIPTKQNTTWGCSVVRRVLENVNYIGNVRHHVREKNEYSVDGKHKAIINQDLFDMAQRILENNKRATPRKHPCEDNYFSGFLKCGICGRGMVTHNVYKKRKDGTQSVSRNYRCQNAIAGACSTSGVNHKKVEIAFEEYIMQVANLNVSDKIEIEIQTHKKQENEMQIKAYQTKVRQLDAKEREAMTFYVENKIELESYREIKKMVDKEKVIISAELARLETVASETQINKADIIDDFRENWDEFSTNERRQFLLKFIGKIILKSEKRQGEHFSTAKVLDVEFLPSHKKKRSATKEIKRLHR